MERQTILALLSHYGPMYGLDLIERSEGRLKRGTIYVHLNSMEDEGLVFSDLVPQPDGPARRQYRISEWGERLIES